jgi:cysteine-rich repeat protein
VRSGVRNADDRAVLPSPPMMRSPRIGAAAVAVLTAACFHEAQPADTCTSDNCDDDGSGGTTSPGESSSGASTTATSATTQDGSEASTTTTTQPSDSSGSSGGQALCGDGEAEADEQCDDGNADPFDGCHECMPSPQLSWQFTQDYVGGDDRAESVFGDGTGVLVAGMGANVGGDDAIWLRVADGDISPPGFFHAADLPDVNRLFDITRRGDSCAIGGVVTPIRGTLQVAGNFIDCNDGTPQQALPFSAPEAAGTEDALTAVVLDGNGDVIVGGHRLHGGAVFGWIQRFDPTGAMVLETLWLDDAVAFGAGSRVQALAFDGAGRLLVAGTSGVAPAQHGFAAIYDAGALDQAMRLGADDLSTEASDIVATPQAIVISGWTIVDEVDRDAIVQSIPVGGGDAVTWTLAGPDDDRAHGVAATDEGIAVTGGTTTAQGGRDLFVAWLDADLAERARAVFDGPTHGFDEGRDLVADADAVVVAGTVATPGGGDMLVQRWLPPP